MAAISRVPAGRGQGRSRAPLGSGTRGELRALDAELRSAAGAAGGRGRCVRASEGEPRAVQRCPGPGNSGSASHTRLKSVLNKVAQLESKIMGQKKHLEMRSAGSGVKALAEECSSSSSSSSRSAHPGGAGGKRCWEDGGGKGSRRDCSSEEQQSFPSSERNGRVQQRLGLDSDEEEMRELMESSLRFSSGNGDRKVLFFKKSKTPVPSGAPPHGEVSPAELSEESSCPNQVSERSESGRVNSPAPSASSRKLPGRATRDQVLSSRTENTPVKIPLPKAGCSKQIQESLESDRSEIKSLDELFSEGADAEDPTSSSLKSFRLNILSLDDLAPDPGGKAAELKQKGKDILFAQDWDKDLLEEEQAAVTITRAVTAVGDSPAEELEECISAAEISEHLSGLSSDSPPHNQDHLHEEERTLDCEYSEDFESSLSAAAREPAGGQPRVGLRDSAAQTGEPWPGSCWAWGSSSPAPPPSAGAALGADAAQALSARSPSALLLHSVCQQQLLLTRRFLRGARRLHSALVEALEQESFHYHSLEEAKEYIKKHRPPPLTLEQALEEVRRAQES